MLGNAYMQATSSHLPWLALELAWLLLLQFTVAHCLTLYVVPSYS